MDTSKTRQHYRMAIGEKVNVPPAGMSDKKLNEAPKSAPKPSKR